VPVGAQPLGHPLNGLAIDAMTGVTLERLRQEHEHSWYSELQLLAPSGYFLIGFDSTILRANIAGAGMLGIDRTNLDGARLRDFISPRFSEDFERFLRSAINDQAGCTCMLRLQPAALREVLRTAPTMESYFSQSTTSTRWRSPLMATPLPL
jgi:PAS domain-containing protein